MTVCSRSQARTSTSCPKGTREGPRLSDRPRTKPKGPCQFCLIAYLIPPSSAQSTEQACQKSHSRQGWRQTGATKSTQNDTLCISAINSRRMLVKNTNTQCCLKYCSTIVARLNLVQRAMYGSNVQPKPLYNNIFCFIYHKNVRTNHTFL